jgi:hypothetical protein
MSTLYLCCFTPHVDVLSLPATLSLAMAVSTSYYEAMRKRLQLWRECRLTLNCEGSFLPVVTFLTGMSPSLIISFGIQTDTATYPATLPRRSDLASQSIQKLQARFEIQCLNGNPSSGAKAQAKVAQLLEILWNLQAILPKQQYSVSQKRQESD